jgi:glucose/arabinose dehydrogenase
MSLAPDGTLLVAERGADRVIALPDRDGDGRADETVVVGTGYDLAHSLAFVSPTEFLVAGITRVTRVTIGPDLRETGRSTFLDGLPAGGHSTRTVLPLADGSVLLSVGSSCNVCEEADERRAAVIRISSDGATQELYMRGLRNAVGLTEDPATGSVWATNMGRDFLGDDSPPETLYRLQDGADAGWPRCHAGSIIDPEFGRRPSPATGAVGCDGVLAPDGTFQAHAAPLGLAFWRDRALIAFHGSWNRSSKVGYEVAWMPWSDGPAGDLASFAGGFLDPATGQATGRPAGLLVGSDGALYISDDKAGIVYRITAP